MTSPSDSGRLKRAATTSEACSAVRRVLVLEGGGAKGAYTFGCMLAFARAKIRFEAVAGTSVGALNALLWCTNSMRAGIELWRSISFSTVYPVRFCDPAKHRRIVVTIFASAYVLCRLFWATAKGTPTPARSLFRSLLSFVNAVSVVCIALFDPQTHQIITVILIFALAFWICWMLLDGSVIGRSIFLGYISAFYLTTLGKFVANSTAHFVHSRWLIGLTVGLTVALTILSCCMVWWILGWWLAFDKSVLASSPLRKSISSIISSSTFELPALATIAREVEVFDPDSPHWYSSSRRYPLYSTCYPQTSTKWRATYVQLNQLRAEDALQCCLASAAMPFGIVPPVQVGGRLYVDGGVADNCPVYPFLNRDDIDEIFIVLLSPYGSDEGALRATDATLRKWQERQRDEEVVKFPIPKSCYGIDIPYLHRNKPPKVIPYRTPKPFPVFVPFYPSSSLGNFMSGTLNFSGRFSRRSICRGYADTRHRLRTLGYWR